MNEAGEVRKMTCVGKKRDDMGCIIEYELREYGNPAAPVVSYGVDYLRRAVLSREIAISNLFPDPDGTGFLPVGEKPAFMLEAEAARAAAERAAREAVEKPVKARKPRRKKTGGRRKRR